MDSYSPTLNESKEKLCVPTSIIIRGKAFEGNSNQGVLYQITRCYYKIIKSILNLLCALFFLLDSSACTDKTIYEQASYDGKIKVQSFVKQNLNHLKYFRYSLYPFILIPRPIKPSF